MKRSSVNTENFAIRMAD